MKRTVNLSSISIWPLPKNKQINKTGLLTQNCVVGNEKSTSLKLGVKKHFQLYHAFVERQYVDWALLFLIKKK